MANDPFEATSPAHDHAAVILQQAPELTPEMRETLWEVFHSKSTPEDLAKVLEHFVASNETKHRLWEAKQMTAPVIDPVQKVRAAIESVARMDKATLEAAEKHSGVLKLFVESDL
jgi:hypothetical protein